MPGAFFRGSRVASTRRNSVLDTVLVASSRTRPVLSRARPGTPPFANSPLCVGQGLPLSLVCISAVRLARRVYFPFAFSRVCFAVRRAMLPKATYRRDYLPALPASRLLYLRRRQCK